MKNLFYLLLLTSLLLSCEDDDNFSKSNQMQGDWIGTKSFETLEIDGDSIKIYCNYEENLLLKSPATFCKIIHSGEDVFLGGNLQPLDPAVPLPLNFKIEIRGENLVFLWEDEVRYSFRRFDERYIREKQKVNDAEKGSVWLYNKYGIATGTERIPVHNIEEGKCGSSDKIRFDSNHLVKISIRCTNTEIWADDYVLKDNEMTSESLGKNEFRDYGKIKIHWICDKYFTFENAAGEVIMCTKEE